MFLCTLSGLHLVASSGQSDEVGGCDLRLEAASHVWLQAPLWQTAAQ